MSAVSLTDALCQILRANPLVTAAFGDTFNSSLSLLANQQAGNVSKFWADWADQVGQPYLVFEEVFEEYDRNTVAPGQTFISNGIITCRIFQSGRELARALGIQICNALNNCDQHNLVTWNGFSAPSKLMDLYMRRADFVPNPEIGPGVPATFNRVITFEYTYEGYT